MNVQHKIGLLALALTITGCSVLEGDKVDYKSATKAPTLEVPPDLTQLSRDARYIAPKGNVSASEMQAMQQPSLRANDVNATATPAMGDVRIERDGDQRRLIIQRPASVLWEPIRSFWQNNGFTLASADPALGIMETDWAENRAKLPQDFIRSTLGKVLDSLYSTGERDKFRTRLEKMPNGDTEIYVTHRGMQEVYNSSARDSTIWQPRAADPELETEFLRRLMVQLGVSQQQASATAVVNVQAAAPTAILTTTAQQTPMLELNDSFDRAWRRVGVSLDRTGFTVEDRNRAEGVYFVRYVAPVANKKERGFFSKLFTSEPEAAAPLKYRIVVRSANTGSTVSVLSQAGTEESSANAQRILKVLFDDLK